MFEALLKRKRSEARQEYLRAGLIAATVMNFSVGRPDKPASETDFVPEWLKDEELDSEVDLTKLTPEQQMAHVRKVMSKRIYTQRG